MATDLRIPTIDDAVHGFMPVIVLGWQGEAPTASRVGNLVEPLTRIAHQYGGYACLHAEVVGLVLRLGANVEPAAALLAAFQGLAESNEGGGDPVLDALGSTHRDPYGPDELRELDRFLARLVRLPPLEQGCEAFLRFAEADLARLFTGWRVWRPVGESLRVSAELLATLGPGLRAFLLWENSD